MNPKPENVAQTIEAIAAKRKRIADVRQSAYNALDTAKEELERLIGSAGATVDALTNKPEINLQTDREVDGSRAVSISCRWAHFTLRVSPEGIVSGDMSPDVLDGRKPYRLLTTGTAHGPEVALALPPQGDSGLVTVPLARTFHNWLEAVLRTEEQRLKRVSESNGYPYP